MPTSELLEFVRNSLQQLEWRSVIDIVVVTLIAYWVLSFIQGTTAMAVLRGIVLVLLIGTVLSRVLGLTVLGWLLRNSFTALIIAIPIIFQPEIRRVLEEVGRGGFSRFRRVPVATASQRTIDTIASAAGRLSELRWGGLIVMERQVQLGEYMASGVRIDGALSEELLLNVFYPHSPMHDGAVIVRGERLVAARAVLPLADSVETGYRYGTRHRAGLGITEKTDALSVVISEETGKISICNNGRMVSNLDEQKLRRVLMPLYKTTVGETIPSLLRKRKPAN
jgi:diadenylate cyclase